MNISYFEKNPMNNLLKFILLKFYAKLIAFLSEETTFYFLILLIHYLKVKLENSKQFEKLSHFTSKSSLSMMVSFYINYLSPKSTSS